MHDAATINRSVALSLARSVARGSQAVTQASTKNINFKIRPGPDDPAVQTKARSALTDSETSLPVSQQGGGSAIQLECSLPGAVTRAQYLAAGPL